MLYTIFGSMPRSRKFSSIVFNVHFIPTHTHTSSTYTQRIRVSARARFMVCMCFVLILAESEIGSNAPIEFGLCFVFFVNGFHLLHNMEPTKKIQNKKKNETKCYTNNWRAVNFFFRSIFGKNCIHNLYVKLSQIDSME